MRKKIKRVIPDTNVIFRQAQATLRRLGFVSVRNELHWERSISGCGFEVALTPYAGNECYAVLSDRRFDSRDSELKVQAECSNLEKAIQRRLRRLEVYAAQRAKQNAKRREELTAHLKIIRESVAGLNDHIEVSGKLVKFFSSADYYTDITVIWNDMPLDVDVRDGQAVVKIVFAIGDDKSSRFVPLRELITSPIYLDMYTLTND